MYSYDEGVEAARKALLTFIDGELLRVYHDRKVNDAMEGDDDFDRYLDGRERAYTFVQRYLGYKQMFGR